MTVLPWNRATAQPADAQPQTHALVIGVAHYAHLLGGSKHAAQPCTENLNRLKQLISPVPSAVAFADFLRSDYRNTDKPLGSVDVLLSPQAKQPVPPDYQNVERATFDKIQAAFAAWILRCTRHPENIGIFYFCGHGLEKAEHIVLPEDFGSNPNNAWDTGIAFDTTHAAMGANKFATQLYLLDACRELPLSLAMSHHVQPRALETLRGRRLHDRDAPILRAATKDQQAQAPKGQVSYFTTAVLECFRAFGAERRSGQDWIVTTSSLKRAVQLYMERHAKNRCDTGGGVSNFTSDLHEFSGHAQVFAEICCAPEAAHKLAKFTLSNPLLTNPLERQRPEPDPWLLNVHAVDHDIAVTFQPADGYQDLNEVGHTAWPPLFTPKLTAHP